MKTIRRVAWAVGRILMIALALPALGLFLYQDRLIYLPRAYGPEPLPQGVVELHADTPFGRQRSFWLPPRAGGTPQRVWIACGGNGSLALDWLPTVQASDDPQAGWLLVEYPGYGGNPGAPSPARILAGTEAAVGACAAHLGLDAAALRARACGLGHSLGAAAILQYAAAHPLRGLVLVAPFTAMIDMARRSVGWPLCQVLVHRFDNRARLAEVVAGGTAPVVIVHGEADRLIPLAMGRELAEAHGSRVVLRPVPGAGHNDVLEAAELPAAMQAVSTSAR